MTVSEFFKYLGLFSLAAVVSLFFMHQIPAISPFQSFSWLSCVFFIVLNIAMFGLASKSAKSQNKHNFTTVIVLFVILKMLFAVVLVFGFHKIAMPQSNAFLIPFFWIYLIYTIFETYFMTRVGKG